MKNLLSRCTTGLISFLALINCALAQTVKPGSGFSGLTASETAFSKSGSKSNALIADRPTMNVHARALKNFSKTYKTGSPSWFETREGYLAQMEENGIKTKVFYDHKGNKTGTIKSYFEDKLAANIRHLVKSVYYDYSIYFVQEVTVGNVTAYLVKIEDKVSLKTIRVVDGEMDVYEALTKAN